MNSQSIWINGEKKTSYPKLQGEKTVDVAIIGGGICGITAAQLLSEKGFKVSVIEASEIAVSNTGRSTGNLYGMVDSFLVDLKAKYGEKKVQDVVFSRLDTLKAIELTIQKYHISCDFNKVPWVRFSAHPEMDKKIESEFELAKKMDLPATLLKSGHKDLLAFAGRIGVRIENQAQFNPYKYVVGLAHAIEKKVEIFEHSRVTDIQEKDGLYQLITDAGSVHANHVIEATHTPLGISVLQTLLGPYREYGIAFEFTGEFNEGIYWGHYEKDKVISVRHYQKEEKKYLLTIGEPHKVGQAESLDGIKKLKDHSEKYFQTGKTIFSWGGQHYRPADLLPYIGRKGLSNIHIATGFSTDGLIYGALAASIITAEIAGEKHAHATLYSSHRVAPLKSASKFIHENLNVAKQYVVDYFKKNTMQELGNGEGMVVQIEDHKVAVCKTMSGVVSTSSAICPHLGCVVHWNKGEQSWDCPCHGSRFDNMGEVIEGPAFVGLKKI